VKKLYFAVTFFILTLSAVFVGYGIYLNSTSDSYIESMLASRVVSLSGIKVSYRDLYPEILIDYIDLRTRTLADAIAQIEGKVEDLYVRLGDDVVQGQPIARIVNYDVPLLISRANADIAKAEAAYLQFRSVAERNQRLAVEDAISAGELEASVSQMNASKADLDAAKISKQQIEQQSGFQVVTAPISGSVLVIYQRPGNFVSMGIPVVMIADFSKMFFTALIDDRQVKNLAPLDGVFSLHIDLDNMKEKAFDSAAGSSFGESTAFDVTISRISPPLSDMAPIRSVMFEIGNHIGVMEIGMYTDTVIRKETPKRALAIPLAVVFDQDDPKVHVCDADSKLVMRGIRLGVYDDKYVEVAEGLAEGDVVITSGIEGLDLGVRVNVNLEEDLR